MTDSWDGTDGVFGSRLGSAPCDAGLACGGGVIAARVLASAGRLIAAIGAVASTAKAAA